MKGKMNYVALILILLIPNAFADSQDEIKRGEEIAKSQCDSCHNTTLGEVPLLYGQSSKYLEEALKQYASDKRKDNSTFKSMNGLASVLSGADMKAVSQYYSQEEPCQVAGTLSPGEGNIGHGRVIVKQCTICHKKKISSPNGAVPRIVGQKTTYLVHAMKEHRDAIHPTGMMEGVLDSFSDEDLADIAAYLNRYSHCQPKSLK